MIEAVFPSRHRLRLSLSTSYWPPPKPTRLTIHGGAFVPAERPPRADDFNSLRGEVTSTRELARGDWRMRTDTRTVLTSTESEFRVRADLDAYEDGTRIFCRSWDRRIPRDFV